MARRADHAHGAHQGEDLAEAVLEEPGDVEQDRAQPPAGVDLLEVTQERPEVQGVVDGGLDQLLLGLEDPEDRALGHPGRPGDLAGGDGSPVLEQQREGRPDQLLSALLGAHRCGSGHARQYE